MDKKDFLITFDNFLETLLGEYPNSIGKCYFKLTNKRECQGWIFDILTDTFEYHDSGPLAREESYFFKIEDIDVNTFAYWDEEIKKWTEYFGPDKFENRNKSRIQ